EGVPWFVRSGKNMACTAAEGMVQRKVPPQKLLEDSAPADGPANYLRLRFSPRADGGLAARENRPRRQHVGEQRELYVLNSAADSDSPYERLLGDALAGGRSLFASQDAVEATWKVLDKVLTEHEKALPYEKGSWGPEEAQALLGSYGPWHNPCM